MDNINIFVAGAKDLSKQRNLVKAWANDFNEDSSSSRIIVRSYENFPNNQPAYDGYIKNVADIVLFVIDGKIGEKTENELKLASSCRDKNGKPKVFVFVKKFTTKTKEMEHVEEVVNEYVGEYYIEYKNDEDLISKVERHVKKCMNNINPPITIKRICIISAITIGTIITSVCIFFSLGLGLSYLMSDKQVAKEVVENNIIPLYDNNALLFKYEDMLCYYYLENDSLGDLSYNDSLDIVDVKLSKSNAISALSISSSTIVLQKYTNKVAQKLNRGGKPQKIAAICLMAGVYVGTFIGISQGFAFGESIQRKTLRDEIKRLVRDLKIWEYKAQRVKQIQMEM